jgi:hypothetical protein
MNETDSKEIILISRCLHDACVRIAEEFNQEARVGHYPVTAKVLEESYSSRWFRVVVIRDDDLEISHQRCIIVLTAALGRALMGRRVQDER